MSNPVDLVDTIVSQYLKTFPEERAGLAALIEQITNEDVLNNPATLPGHITGAAVVLSPDKTKLLLIHHKFLNMWLQPGGHWEPGEADPLTAAKREAEEETAVSVKEYIPLDADLPLVPFDFETHPIPENVTKGMPAHLHHDFRYVFIADDLALRGLDSEVNEAGWFAFDAPECENVTRIILKMRERGFIEA